MEEQREQKKTESGFLAESDCRYPELLRKIPDPPAGLYYRGRPEWMKARCFAVVGTRKPTEYGRWAAFRIGQRLAESGITVVSGMAAGIDSLAHRGALHAGGKTIAVMGCGLHFCFPASNRPLMREIGEKGLLLSEYPPEHPPAKYTFPRRNRIISGLCEGVIVVEAGLSSGSLITAELAAEQGRSVYALPGNINRVMSIGTNKLLRDGALPIAVIDDLLWDLGVRGEAACEFSEALSGEERKLAAWIEAGGEVTASELCRISGKSPAEINGMVTVLEMKGIICTSFGKIFIAK